jgi:hypothetical protein
VISGVRNPQDFWAGLLYAVIGLTAVYLAQDYRMGSAIKMGPGYFPTLLGGSLAFIGVASLIRSFVRPGEPIGSVALKGMLLVVGGTLLAGYLIRNAGVVIAVPALVLISAYASIRFRWGTALLLAAGLTLFAALVFVKALGLPLPILGRWFD